MDEGLATLLTGGLATIIALAAGYAGFSVNQNRRREDFTSELLMQRFSNDHIRRGRAILYRLVETAVDIPADALRAERSEYDDVMNLLAYYEFVAVSYFNGRLDKRTVKEQAGRAMELTFRCCHALIRERRQIQNDHKLFANLERFCRKK